MAMTKKGVSKNGIMSGLISISEAFKSSNITEDDIAETITGIDLLSYFKKVKDWRNPDSITYQLHDILMMSFMIILSQNVNSFNGIANQIRVRKKYYTDLNLIHDNKYPSHDTIRRIFETLDNESLYDKTIRIFYDYLLSLEDCLADRYSYKQIMIDGKEVRGSGRSASSKFPKKNTNVLNIFDSTLQVCIHSEPIDDKTNEIPTAQAALRDMDLRGTVVTADALHCQRETASIIHKKKGIYVLCAKDNQPLLVEEISSRLKKNSGSINEYISEKRRIEILHLPKNYGWDGFAGLKSFVKVTSYIHSPKTPTTRFFISNTDKDELVCEGIENRWDIENGLHREKDNFLSEDSFRSTNKGAICGLAIINNFALMLVRLLQMFEGISLSDAKIKMRCETLSSLGKILSISNSSSITEKVKKQIKKARSLARA